MPRIHLSLCDIKVSNQASDTLVAKNIATNLALAIHDPEAGVGGMLTSLLPEPEDENQAEQSPSMFVSNGVPLLIRELEKIGADTSRMVVKAAGCASMLGALLVFDNGSRNIEELRRRLKKAGLALNGEDLGGTTPRTMSMHIGTGKVTVHKLAEELEL